MYFPPEPFLNAELAYRREQIVAARRTRTSAPAAEYVLATVSTLR